MTGRCDACRFFGEHTRLESTSTSAASGIGSCRRHAPRGPVLDLANVVGIDFFPPVPVSGWCGEFQASPTEFEKLAARIEEADRVEAAKDLLRSASRRKVELHAATQVERYQGEEVSGDGA